MKQLRLLAFATCCAAGLIAFGSAHACDAHKSSKGTSASAASAASSMPDCCAAKASKGGKVNASAASHAACSATKSASHAACASSKGASAAASKDCCMSKGASASAAGASGGCMMNAAHAMAMDCSACEDWALCETQIDATGARSQVVALKNGVMIVYTAEGAEGVRAVQAAVARRGEGMKASITSRKADAKLCPDCKQMRGALASGKLHREVVNVEKGAMDLLTSNDKAIVQKIHSMTGAQIAAR